jgi:hypothetical protein
MIVWEDWEHGEAFEQQRKEQALPIVMILVTMGHQILSFFESMFGFNERRGNMPVGSFCNHAINLKDTMESRKETITINDKNIKLYLQVLPMISVEIKDMV